METVKTKSPEMILFTESILVSVKLPSEVHKGYKAEVLDFFAVAK
jgi:hypothetical protein